MRQFLFAVLLFSSELLCCASHAASLLPAPEKRPRICVVLSGGGARGFAHIGVLKYLESQHIPIDCIAGTSIGAVIGGLYAAGLPADEIERRLENIQLDQVVLDIVDRRHITQTLRNEDNQYPIAATFGISDTGVNLPRGVVQASQFSELLHNWTAHIPPDISFDALTIPFRAVATDLENGKMVVFDQGPLHTAIRASMATPGVFAPIEVNGHLLSDGGLVRNLPVDIARSMGADVIIAVNIGTPLLAREKLQTILNISEQTVTILTEQNVIAQKKTLLPGDVLIEPDLGDISFMDFTRAKDAEAIGYHAASTLQQQLLPLSMENTAYLNHLQQRPAPKLPPIRIAFVDVITSGKIPADDIRRQLHIQIGSVYDAADINRRITPLINSRQFDHVRHELITRNTGDKVDYGVQITASERNWGPNFIRAGLSLSTGFDGVSGFKLQLGQRRPWLSDSGLEWRNDLQFGTTYGLRSELRQPLLERNSMYLAPYIDIQMNKRNLYVADTRIAEYVLQDNQAGLDLGIPLGDNGNQGEARLGAFVDHYNIRPGLGEIDMPLSNSNPQLTSFPSVQIDDFGWRSRLVVDQLDGAVFPHAGYQFESELLIGMNRSTSDSTQLVTHDDFRSFQQMTLNTKWASSINNTNSINISARLGARFQSGDPIPGFGMSLGGFQLLSAYQPDQFIGNYLAYGNVTYLFRALNLGLADEALFFGTSLEIGNAGNSSSDFTLNNTKKSLTFFIGARTFIGPIHIGIAIAPSGARNLFLQMGHQ